MLLPIPEDVLQAQVRERTIDMLLTSCGLSAAAVSASFAAYMIAVSPGVRTAAAPRAVLVARGVGVDHQSPRTLQAPDASMSEAADASAAPGLDFLPTGTIPDIPETRPPSDAATIAAVLPDFAVRDAFDDTALVEARGTLQMVRPGSVLEGAGEVLSIARQGSGWVVRTAGGTIVGRR